jgi:hypothetical protein
MANYAVIEDSKVINVIISDSKEIAEEATGKLCIEYTEENPAGIDWDYDGVSFIAPVVEEPTETEETPTE